MIRSRQKTRPIFLRYLLLYMGLFLFMCFLLITIYRQVLSSARDTLLDSYSNHLERATLSLEQTVTRCQNSAYSVAQSGTVSQLSLARPETLKSSVMHMHEASELLAKTHSLISDETAASLLIYPNNEYIVTNAFVSNDYRKEYLSLFEFEGMTALEWYAAMLKPSLQNTMLPRMVMHSKYFVGHSQKEVLPLIVPLQAVGSYRLANMVFCLDAQKISRMVMDERMQEQGFRFALTNAAGETLLGGLDESDASYLLLQGQRTEGLGLQISLGIPEDVFLQEVSSITMLIKSCILWGLAGGLALAVGYALHHFWNVRRILQASGSLPASTSPYRYVQDVLQELSQTRDELSQKLLLLENTYTTNLLINVCVHGLSSEKDLQEARRLIPQEVFCAAVLRIDAEHCASPELMEAENQFARELDAIVLHHRVEESVFILPVHENLPQLASRLTAYGVLGLSQPCQDIRTIHSCYQQAHHALQDCTFQHRVCVYTHAQGSTPFLWDLEQLTTLQNWIQSGKEERVKQFFANLHDRADYIVGTNRLQHFFVLRQLLRRLTEEMKCAPGQMETLLVPQTDELTRDGLRRLEQYALYLTNTAQENLSSRTSQTVSAIISIIEAEFSNPELSADYLAQRLNVSSKYIYLTVKEQTHKTVGEWIEETRLQFAAEMLLHTDKKNEEISQLCGFGTINTFYRVFRKKYGFAPLEWRKAMKNGVARMG